MGILRLGLMFTPVVRWRVSGGWTATLALVCGLLPMANGPLSAATPSKVRRDPSRATTSLAARRSAEQSIPIERLDAAARAKVRSVLSHTSVFRRLPVHVVDCDPEMYLFLVRHPDVVVNIWEVLKLSNLKLRQVGPGRYRVTEKSGTTADVEFLYRSHDTHVIYARFNYEGKLFIQPVQGQCLLVLKTGYVRETDGRYYITTRLDTFLHVEQVGAELLAKTFHPWMGKTADRNFVQSVAFLGSLSKTAEVNSGGVQRLAARLIHVQPEVRSELAELAAKLPGKYAPETSAKTPDPAKVTRRPGADPKR